ncbi:hypothetical protein KPH14_002842 [Odynerus spinipes]|uniref:MD-2-related lipid-recognition domain-containing protein n=1 Tax=Odynerus spinipes TaxID=1348599 RepID=A0AAD9VLN5_9HYME|nr:hypothetical protein KPH14_002842 [Odynerus spinipes]
MALLACVYLLAAFCIALSAQSTPFFKCTDGTPAPLDLRIKGCNSLPCPLIRGTDLTAEWDFEVTANTETLKPRVKVTLFGVTTEYPYPHQNACNDLTNGECPLEKGEEITYALKMPILKGYPLLTLNIEFALVDENENSQTFRFITHVRNTDSTDIPTSIKSTVYGVRTKPKMYDSRGKNFGKAHEQPRHTCHDAWRKTMIDDDSFFFWW